MRPPYCKLEGAVLAAALFMVAGAPAIASEGEASLIEGDGILSLLQGGGLAPSTPDSGSLALVVQSGPENRLMSDQTAAGLGTLLLMHQIGEDNLAEVVQSGASNAASISQVGTGNMFALTQLGGDNSLIQLQQGDSLGIAITQYGGAQMVITQRNE